VVLITPTVISSNDEARGVTDELRKKLPSLEHLMQKQPDATAAK
jgi:type II secretory pathway component GspD/PulD (secretin)